MRHAKTNFKMLKPFLMTVEKNRGYSQFRSPFGYMPLSIEDLHYNDYFGDRVYAISHIGVQNGDIMRDPEVQIGVNFTDGTVRPLYYRNDYMPWLEQNVFDSARIYRPQLLTELDGFLWQWLKDTITKSYNPALGIAIQNA